MDAQFIIHKNPHPTDFLKLPQRQVMVPVSRVNKKSHFLKRTTIETSQNIRVSIAAGTRVIAIVNLFIDINQLDALNFLITLFQASICFEHMRSSSGGQNCITRSLVSSHSVGGRSVHGTVTYRCDDTRDCIVQFWPPDNEHLCSKHVEA